MLSALRHLLIALSGDGVPEAVYLAANDLLHSLHGDRAHGWLNYRVDATDGGFYSRSGFKNLWLSYRQHFGYHPSDEADCDSEDSDGQKMVYTGIYVHPQTFELTETNYSEDD